MSESPGCLGYLLNLLRGGLTQKAAPLRYRLRDDFLSPAERSFYGVLCQVAGTLYSVLAKVRLADVLYVPRTGNRNWTAQQNRINQKHVDFLLCNPGTMAPVLAIELDDASHRRRDRAARDEFVDAALKVAGLPVGHVPVKASYTADDVRAPLMLLTHTGEQSLSAAPSKPGLGTETSAAHQESSDTKPGIESLRANLAPKCPKCGADTVLRTAVKGAHKGEQFYGCSQFPRCRGVVQLEN
jgi:hypothetical protein